MFLSAFDFYEPVRGLHFNNLEQMLLASGVGRRLLVACVLGGAIGMEREYHGKSLGLRTNLLICSGCAMFTFLSAILAGDNNPDKGRVAANIVQGIGFLGAGLIMRNQYRVIGLTNASTVIAEIQRISFSVLGTQGQHKMLMATLRASPVIGQLHTYHDAEDE